MAKLGGEQTELLQISADERARAARTALLFSEEELTRNLQIVLRTFDDLNYRQEQRFHLELGLLKLIHAQRLLPIEELLSGVAGGAGANATASSLPRASASSARPASAPSHSAARACARNERLELQPAAEAERRAGKRRRHEQDRLRPPSPRWLASTVARELSPFPAVGAQAAGYASTESLTEGALAKAPETAKATNGELNIESIRQDIVSASGHRGARFSRAVAGQRRVAAGEHERASFRARNGQEDAQLDGECRGGEDRAPGIAAAGRADAFCRFLPARVWLRRRLRRPLRWWAACKRRRWRIQW